MIGGGAFLYSQRALQRRSHVASLAPCSIWDCSGACQTTDHRFAAVAPDRAGHRLVEQPHTVCGTALLHQRSAERRHRQQFQVRVPVGACDLHGLGG